MRSFDALSSGIPIFMMTTRGVISRHLAHGFASLCGVAEGVQVAQLLNQKAQSITQNHMIICQDDVDL